MTGLHEHGRANLLSRPTVELLESMELGMDELLAQNIPISQNDYRRVVGSQMRRDHMAGNGDDARFAEYADPDLLELWENSRTWAENIGGELFTEFDEDDERRRFIGEGSRGLSAALVEMGTEVRYDVRSQCPQILTNRHEWVDFNDRIEATLRDAIAGIFSFARKSSRRKDKWRAVPARWSNSGFDVVFNALLAEYTCDPFMEWLQDLPEWDGTKRIDNWLSECGFQFTELTGMSNDQWELTEWCNRSILMLACQRAIEPGAKHDVIPVIVGPQGCGKSTALEHLFPYKHRERWFTDALKLSGDDKRRVEALQGAVIVEASEMTGATSADIDSLKAFLSRSNDRIRLSYRRNPEPHPRLVSIVGTANGTAVLPNDSTGNRRFAVCEVDSGSARQVRAYLEDNRQQMWAEAYRRVTSGEDVYLPSAAAPAQTERNEKYRSADVVIEEQVARFMQKQVDRNWFTMAEVAEGIGLTSHGKKTVAELSRSDINRIARCLEAAGCRPERVYTKGVRVRAWVLPE